MKRKTSSTRKRFTTGLPTDFADLAKRRCVYCGERLAIEEVDEFRGACSCCASKWQQVFDPRV
jgi:hypothetical protein